MKKAGFIKVEKLDISKTEKKVSYIIIFLKKSYCKIFLPLVLPNTHQLRSIIIKNSIAIVIGRI